MHSSTAPILKVTFNCSINTGVAPNDWKAANIKFLFKKVDRLPTSNYCPISLTSIISKFLNIFMLQYCETPSSKWDSQSSPAWILTHLLLWDPINFPSTLQWWHDIHIYVATYVAMIGVPLQLSICDFIYSYYTRIYIHYNPLVYGS